MDIFYTLYSFYVNKKINLLYHEPIHIIENLFIGNIYNLSNWATIRDYNFKFIINTNDKSKNYFENTSLKITYENINVEDSDEQNFNKILNFIEESQSINDVSTNRKINILIAGNELQNNIIIILLFLKYKYRLTLNKCTNLLNSKIKTIKIKKNNLIKYYNMNLNYNI